jgi:hypothetical protein
VPTGMNTGVLTSPWEVVIFPRRARDAESVLINEKLNTSYLRVQGSGVRVQNKLRIDILPHYTAPWPLYPAPCFTHILSGAFTPNIVSAFWITVFTCFMRNSLTAVRFRSSVMTRCLK